MAAAETPLWCLLCGEHGAVDFLLNIALFIPLGAGLAATGRRLWPVVLAGCLTSALVESTQATLLAGRDPSLGDLVANTCGAAAGWLLYHTRTAWLSPPERRARLLGRTALATWVAVQLVTAWGLQPHAPVGRYFGQWRQERPGYELFPGEVLNARLNRILLPRGPAYSESDEIRQELVDSISSLVVTAVTGQPTAGYAPIAAVAFHKPFQLAAVGQSDRDLIATRRFRISRLLLRSPSLTVTGALPIADTVRIENTLSSGTWRLAVDVRGERSATEVQRSPSWTWAVLIPWDIPLTRQPVWPTALWLILMLTPAGFWYAIAGGPRRILIRDVTLGLVAGLGLAPLLGGLNPVAWHEWLAASTGLLLGIMAGSRVRLRRRMTWPVDQTPGELQMP